MKINEKIKELVYARSHYFTKQSFSVNEVLDLIEQSCSIFDKERTCKNCVNFKDIGVDEFGSCKCKIGNVCTRKVHKDFGCRFFDRRIGNDA